MIIIPTVAQESQNNKFSWKLISKKENTNFLDYCYSLEKIISINKVEKYKYLSKKFRPLEKDIALIVNKKKVVFVGKFHKSCL